MNRDKINGLINNKGMDTDGDVYFTLETVMDAFKAGIALGSQGVGRTTNHNATVITADKYQEALRFLEEDR